MTSKCTQKEENFCLHLVEFGNQAAAYRHAFNAANMNDKSVSVEASRVARKPQVAARLKELRQQAAERSAISIERILLEQKRIALFDPRRLYRPDGTLKPIHEMDDDTAAAVASMEIDTKLLEGRGRKKKLSVTITAKVKTHSKASALNDLMRHKGMFEKDNQQKADALGRMLADMGAIDAPPADKA